MFEETSLHADLLREFYLTAVLVFLILRICTDALRYFLSLESSSHRDAWTSLLLLLLNRLLKLDSERVRLC